MKDNFKKDYNSSLALSILQQIGVADLEPEPNFPIQFRSITAKGRNGRESSEVLLGVYPNPVKNEAHIVYPIEMDGHGYVNVTGDLGQTIEVVQLNHKGLLQLDTSKYAAGVYVVQLIGAQQQIDRISFVVIR